MVFFCFFFHHYYFSPLPNSYFVSKMRERNLKSGIQKHFVEKNTTKMNDVEGVLDISIADDDLLAALEIDVSVL